MKKYFIILLAVIATACSTTENRSLKQYRFGEYVFTQEFPGSDWYICSVDSSGDEAERLWQMMVEDYWNNREDLTKSKFYKKYGLVVWPHQMVKPYARLKSGAYWYDDFDNYHIKCTIETIEEYKAFIASCEQEKQEGQRRLETIF